MHQFERESIHLLVNELTWRNRQLYEYETDFIQPVPKKKSSCFTRLRRLFNQISHQAKRKRKKHKAKRRYSKLS